MNGANERRRGARLDEREIIGCGPASTQIQTYQRLSIDHFSLSHMCAPLNSCSRCMHFECRACMFESTGPWALLLFLPCLPVSLYLLHPSSWDSEDTTHCFSIHLPETLLSPPTRFSRSLSRAWQQRERPRPGTLDPTAGRTTSP